MFPSTSFYIHKEYKYIPQTMHIHKQVLGANRSSTSETIKIEGFVTSCDATSCMGLMKIKFIYINCLYT